ncbi:hypothetical protein ACFYSH_02995 [Streptomyces sp. NPDC005791]|uniref:hypothetical protein n=1 Tax=Streptomyces sp. NPDC005791 TaxID=3364732 RepID=UPI003686C430
MIAAGLGVALVPSLDAWAVPDGLVLVRLTDPALRRTVHAARPATPLPAALTSRDLLRDGSRARSATPDDRGTAAV